jgi:hypothetical protein
VASTGSPVPPGEQPDAGDADGVAGPREPTAGAEAPTTSTPWTRSGARGWAALVVVAEAVVLVGAGLYLAVETVVGEANQRAAAAVLTVMVLAVGLALAWCARALAAGREWPRGPVLTWQLVQAAIAFQTLSDRAAMPMPPAARWAMGTPLLAAAVFVIGVLLRAAR